MLFGTLVPDYCTAERCPRMTAGPKYEYYWSHGSRGRKKPKPCAASEYVDYLMQWVQHQIDDDAVFPSKIGTSRSFLNQCFSSLDDSYPRWLVENDIVYFIRLAISNKFRRDLSDDNEAIVPCLRAYLLWTLWWCWTIGCLRPPQHQLQTLCALCERVRSYWEKGTPTFARPNW